MDKPKDDDLDLDLDLELDELSLTAAPLPAELPPSSASPVPMSTTPAGSPTDSSSFSSGGGSAVAEPAGSTAYRPAAASPSGGAAAEEAGVDGQWVWQFAAPAPLPPFSGALFSGRALGELYRFLACGLLVFVGCLLPWEASLGWLVERGADTRGYEAPRVGYELPLGALCMILALWLMASASYGIYTGRQKVLPVFLMFVPAYVSWTRTLSAWEVVGLVPDLSTQDRLARLFEVAGTGVMLTLLGSTIVAVQFVLVLGKVLRKSPKEGGRERKSKDSGKDAAKDSAKDAAKEAAPSGAAAEPAAAEASAGASGAAAPKEGLSGRGRSRKR
ncbi:MAG: hypothetical protein ACT4PU_02570 [Planctomycetota bacterium]